MTRNAIQPWAKITFVAVTLLFLALITNFWSAQFAHVAQLRHAHWTQAQATVTDWEGTGHGYGDLTVNIPDFGFYIVSGERRPSDKTLTVSVCRDLHEARIGTIDPATFSLPWFDERAFVLTWFSIIIIFTPLLALAGWQNAFPYVAATALAAATGPATWLFGSILIPAFACMRFLKLDHHHPLPRDGKAPTSASTFASTATIPPASTATISTPTIAPRSIAQPDPFTRQLVPDLVESHRAQLTRDGVNILAAAIILVMAGEIALASAYRHLPLATLFPWPGIIPAALLLMLIIGGLHTLRRRAFWKRTFATPRLGQTHGTLTIPGLNVFHVAITAPGRVTLLVYNRHAVATGTATITHADTVSTAPIAIAGATGLDPNGGKRSSEKAAPAIITTDITATPGDGITIHLDFPTPAFRLPNFTRTDDVLIIAIDAANPDRPHAPHPRPSP